MNQAAITKVSSGIRLLVVDDDPDMLRLLSMRLTGAGYQVTAVTSAESALTQLEIEHPQLVLMGDYNITFDDADVWDPVGLHETIHCTTEERTQLKGLIGLGLHDAHRLFEHPPKTFSWWDYRMLGFQKNRGLRIDHILVTDALKARATACEVDRVPRKNPQPSDHAPVVLTLD